MRTGNFLLQNNNDKMLLQLFYLNPGSLFETDFLSLLQSLLRDKAHFLPSYTLLGKEKKRRPHISYQMNPVCY